MSFDFVYTLILLVTTAAIFPILGARGYRELVQLCANGAADARMNTYKGYLRIHWPLTVGLLGGWLLLGNDLKSVGLVPDASGWQWLAIGVGAIVVAAQIVYVGITSRDMGKLNEIRQQMGELSMLTPQTQAEESWFDMVSVSAGVCEEILYRGLLLAVLVPMIGLWPAVVVSSLIFGLGHAYQGISGVVKTGALGLVFALLTVFSGSLFIAIILHAVVDLTSGRVMARAMRTASLQTA